MRNILRESQPCPQAGRKCTLWRLRIRILCAALAALLAGGLLYVLFREGNLLAFAMTGKPAFWGQVFQAASRGLFLNILIYNVPSGLWLLSGLLCLRSLWLDHPVKAGIYIRIFCSLALGCEALQYSGLVPGTFDVLDLIAMVLSAFTEGVWYTIFIQRRSKYAE